MTTFFVRQSGGSDANDGLSFANGFATIQHLMDTLTAGDLGLVASDGVYLPAAFILLDINDGTFAAPILVRGAGSLGEDDGSVATISGGGTLGAIFDDRATGGNYTHFEGLRITNATSFGFRFANPQPGILFERCRIDNHGAEGVQIGQPAVQITFIDCELDSNGGSSIRSAIADVGEVSLINCLIHGNGTHGVEVNHVLTIQNCWIYNNTLDGVNCIGAPDFMSVTNTVIDNNGDDGIKASSTTLIHMLIVNNIISNNVGWGVSLEGTDVNGIRGSNLYFTNTLGDVTFDGIGAATLAAFETIGGSLVGDPLFVNTTLGSEDYRIGSGSPALEAGYPTTLMDSTPRSQPNFAHIGSDVPEAAGAPAAGGGIIGG